VVAFAVEFVELGAEVAEALLSIVEEKARDRT
jgi:hypothetical protein